MTGWLCTGTGRDYPTQAKEELSARGDPSAAKQFAEKPTMLTSGAEALVEEEGFIAALKALRHPKPSFSANCKAARENKGLLAALKRCGTQTRCGTQNQTFSAACQGVPLQDRCYELIAEF